MTREMTDDEILFRLNQIAWSSYEYSAIAREAISLIIDQKNIIEEFKEKRKNEQDFNSLS